MRYNMKNATFLLVLPMLFACSKPNTTPEETVKNFYAAMEGQNLEKVAENFAPALKEQLMSNQDAAKEGFKVDSAKNDKCGGQKNLTSSYAVNPSDVKVEGFTLIEYKGQCPAEKQYIALVRQGDQWFIKNFGPLVKQ